MPNISIDLSKLHGFRLLTTSNTPRKPVVSAESLPQMLGARLGEKVGDAKAYPTSQAPASPRSSR